MNSPVFSIKSLSIASVLIPILSFLFGELILFIIITSLILGGSAYWFLNQSKQNSGEEEEDELNNINSDQIDSIQPENVEIKDNLDVGSPDSCSESEIVDPFTCSTEEDSEFDIWDCSGEVGRRTDCSDGSISDEESLIEIELFGGSHKDDYYKDEEINKSCRGRKSPDSVLWWPEMNEEENMIEIDLSVGSIKCSRIEIKA